MLSPMTSFIEHLGNAGRPQAVASRPIASFQTSTLFAGAVLPKILLTSGLHTGNASCNSCGEGKAGGAAEVKRSSGAALVSVCTRR